MFAFHDPVIERYRCLDGRAEIPEARPWIQLLPTTKASEAMRCSPILHRACAP
ncbi:hypothetical protein BEI_2345 [Halomonas beimenensis]|uniref:Uncharacterized protein n=1 Tax=Halomonas beimenensis TaxID=475662 RepID=A0A291P907_9GAMM|nr:hypothetical protein BEI_2345 [Halomonas beimenensis]